MSAKKCFKPSCELEVQYLCKCSSPITYSCDFHFGRHLKLRNKTHSFESILAESCEEAKGSIQRTLKKEKSKKEELRDKSSISFSKYDCNEKTIRRRKLDMELNHQLNQTVENPNKKIAETKITHTPRSVVNLPLRQTYKEFDDTDNHFKSLYLVNSKNNKTKLFIYDTESNREEEQILKTPVQLDKGTCVAQLPNGELFCFGNFNYSGIALIIDSDYRVRVLPFGTPCSFSSAIYFNGNVYCFGGYFQGPSTLSSRFDLNQNRWIKLTPMPVAEAYCSSVAYNGNILIAGISSNILLYSVDIDSFSTIPYKFIENRKILINAGERLYLISSGTINEKYESEIGDEFAWKRIENSIYGIYSLQVYCLLRKGVIYIWCSERKYGRITYKRKCINFRWNKKQ